MNERIMTKPMGRIIGVLSNAEKALTKTELRELGSRANRSKLSLLEKEGIVKKNKIVIPNNTKDLEKLLKGTELIKNEVKRNKVISKIKEKFSEEKFVYTYELA